MKKNLHLFKACIFSLLAMNSIGFLSTELQATDKNLENSNGETKEMPKEEVPGKNEEQDPHVVASSKPSEHKSKITRFFGFMRSNWYIPVGFVVAIIAAGLTWFHNRSGRTEANPTGTPVDPVGAHVNPATKSPWRCSARECCSYTAR